MTRSNAAEEVARAIAFFSSSTDAELLRDVLRAIQPRAAAEARKLGSRRPPEPAAVTPAAEPASAEDALQTAKTVRDFALLQALARAVGRRVEELRSMN